MLTTRRLTIVDLAHADVDELVDMLMDAEIYTFIGDRPASVVDARARVERWLSGSPNPLSRWVNMVARMRDTDLLVGLCQATIALNADSTTNDITLSYIVSTSFGGRGVGTEMMGAFDAELTSTYSPAAVTAHIAPGHVVSESIARSLRLSLSGRRDEDGERVWQRGG